uniref:VWFA domain-containing protein n=1 Tax=Candidatus Kentrum sp. DK TaxID=2126562 RepID=A0A450SC56_9GAMM|nr:MAG: hypothetical protein BECKDK2373C_GA0170839_10277 [Candidatus Kentron sp. DK]
MRSVIVALAMLLALVSGGGHAEEKHVAVIVDTSGSMSNNDRARYTVQVGKILADLLGDNDVLTVTRLPHSGGCSDGVDTGLMFRFDPKNRVASKRDLDGRIQYAGNNAFAPAIKTAAQDLDRSPNRKRMLLIVADSGGLDCPAISNPDLMALKKSGVTIAAINLGSHTGAFDTNPAFDFAEPAPDAPGLIDALAKVYQRFLGSEQVQTGRAADTIEVGISPLVDEAFLVVAADGPVSELESPSGNPSAAKVVPDYRGGGETMGGDGRTRGYRILRLVKPEAGSWRFSVDTQGNEAGWMLIQDSSLALELVSDTRVPKDIEVPIRIAVIDSRDGNKVTDPAVLALLAVRVEIEGQDVALLDDGSVPGDIPGDGVYAGLGTFTQLGKVPMPARLDSNSLSHRRVFSMDVVNASWRLDADVPEAVFMGDPLTLLVTTQPKGLPDLLSPPDRIEASIGSEIVTLRDDGTQGDAAAGDGHYTGIWRPQEMGQVKVVFTAHGGSPAASVEKTVEVSGVLDLGEAIPIDFGTIESHTESKGLLDLTSATVKGRYPARIESDIDLNGAVAEIKIGDDWVYPNTGAAEIELSHDGPRTWPVRVRAGWCLPNTEIPEPFHLTVNGEGPDGQSVELRIPISIQLSPSTWLECWWWILVIAILIALCIFIIYGYIWPARFPPEAGLQISPEEDLNEGFFHPIRGTRGAGAGFYRHARIYLQPDFRLSRHHQGAMARLIAGRGTIRLSPIGGALIEWQSVDGEWLVLGDEGGFFMPGVLYRGGEGQLFFELRSRG